MDLHKALQDIMREPGAPKPRISGKYSLEVCVPPTVVKKESWANPPSARTRAFKETVRQFLSSHTFGAVTDGIARVRVTETGSKFVAEEVRACPNDYYFGLWSHQSDEQRAAAPLPAVKPAPQPAPGFGAPDGTGRLHQATDQVGEPTRKALRTLEGLRLPFATVEYKTYCGCVRPVCPKRDSSRT